MKRILFFVFCLFPFICHANSNIEIRRDLAYRVLALLDTLHCDKIVFTVKDSKYLVLADTPNRDEYFVSFQTDSVIIRKTSIDSSCKKGKYRKHLMRDYENAEPIFDQRNYIHGSISSCPYDSSYCGHVPIDYFVYFNADNHVVLEVQAKNGKCNFIRKGLWYYLILRLVDES